MSGSILILGAVALIALLVGFGFLLGFLRGFHYRIYCGSNHKLCFCNSTC